MKWTCHIVQSKKMDTTSTEFGFFIVLKSPDRAMVGNKIQIGGDLQCREAQTHVSIFSLFDHKFNFAIYYF
jgi:hypothetical protein